MKSASEFEWDYNEIKYSIIYKVMKMDEHAEIHRLQEIRLTYHSIPSYHADEAHLEWPG